VVHVCALEPDIMEQSSETWICDGIDHVVRLVGTIDELVMKPNAVVLERRPSQHVYAVGKIPFVLKSPPDSSPHKPM